MGDGVLFGRYRLGAAVGIGAMARVWRATDLQTGEDVAIKRLHPIAFADDSSRRRLKREFTALRSLRHPNIIRVRELELHEDDAALILDFVDGPTLAERLTAGPRLGPEEAVAIASHVAAALDYAHSAGVIHRDVKPANIVLGSDGRARLLDFGIAHAEAAATAITATDQVTGTFRYMAPEQLRGLAVTSASDVFGLAAVTYEMLAGRPPFDGTTPLAVAEAHLAGPPPIEGIPPALDAALRQALDPDPAARPAGARAFGESLAGALDEAPTVALPVVPGPFSTHAEKPVPGEREVGAGAAVIAPAARRPGADRSPARAAVLGVAGILLAGLVVLAAQPPSPADDTGAGQPEAGTPSVPPAARPSPTPAPVIEEAQPGGNDAGNAAEPDDGDDGGDNSGKGNGKGKGKDGRD